MKSNIIRKFIKIINYKYLLLRKNYIKLDKVIEKEEDKALQYHLNFEKSIALQKYDSCFEILKRANESNRLLRKDIELYVKGILAKYEKDKNYKKAIVLALDIINWKNVDIGIKSMVYHLLGNSYYYSNREKELIDLVEFLKNDDNYKNHPLVRWANTPLKQERKKISNKFFKQT